MKYLGVSAAIIVFAGVVTAANTQVLAQYSPRIQSTPRGSGCGGNPYGPGYVLGCQTGKSAMNKKTIHPKMHHLAKPSTHQ